MWVQTMSGEELFVSTASKRLPPQISQTQRKCLVNALSGRLVFRNRQTRVLLSNGKLSPVVNQQAVDALVDRGLLRPIGQQFTWKLTDAGRALIEANV